ncbi:sodium channel modifier 1, partial [Striga asiatica]
CCSDCRRVFFSRSQAFPMSVFGGDSWGREAVDDLLIDGIEASAYKRLANAKFACLVCPQNPVLDTPIMLSVAYSSPIDDSGCNFRGNVRVSSYMRILVSILLLAKTHVNGSRHKVAKKAASEVFLGQATQHNPKSETGHSTVPSIENCSGCAKGIRFEGTDEGFVRKVPKLDYREQVERELKFTAAGWKRDCHGRWFKDENVRFCSVFFCCAICCHILNLELKSGLLKILIKGTSVGSGMPA